MHGESDVGISLERHDYSLSADDVLQIGGSESDDCLSIRVVSTSPIEVEVTKETGGKTRGVRKVLELGMGYKIFRRFSLYPQETVGENGRSFILVVPQGTSVDVAAMTS